LRWEIQLSMKEQYGIRIVCNLDAEVYLPVFLGEFNCFQLRKVNLNHVMGSSINNTAPSLSFSLVGSLHGDGDLTGCR
jgi:hypothetical protein